MRYAGIDIGKETCHATIVDEQGTVLAQFELENKPAGWGRLEKHLQPGDQVAMEAGTFAYPIHDHLCEHGFDVAMAHPRGVKQITQSDSKTDRKDSHHLAHLLRVGYLPRAYVPRPETLRLRDVLRARRDMADAGTRVKNRIHAYLARNSIRHPFTKNTLFTPPGLAWLKRPRFGDTRDTLLTLAAAELEGIKERRKVLDVQLAKVAVDDPQVQLLMTIKGVDYFLALLITAEIGDLTRFPNHEAFQSYAGCAPRVRESAGVNRGGGAVTSRSPILKWGLGLASEQLLQYDNPIRDYYRHQLLRIKKKQRAKARARRKTAAMVYSMLKTGRPCRWLEPDSHDRKEERLERLSRQEPGI
jgi:transposase